MKFEIPDIFAAKYPQWREIIQSECPLAAAAIRYAVTNSVRIDYRHVGRLEEHDGNVSGAIGLEKTIDIAYLGKTIAEFFDVVSHEVKHRTQMDSSPDFFAWIDFKTDINRTKNSDMYCMKDSYQLPSAQDAALLHAVIELDAYNFGALSHVECANAFRLVDKSAQISPAQRAARTGKAIKQAIAHATNDVMKYVDAELTAAAISVVALANFSDKYGKVPAINWIPMTPDKVQSTIRRLWTEAGYTPTLFGKKGLEDIKCLKRHVTDRRATDSIKRAYNALGCLRNVKAAEAARAQM